MIEDNLGFSKETPQWEILNPEQREIIENTTLIIPDNDGEAHMTIEIAKRLGMDVRISNQPWGARLDRELELNPKILTNSKKTIIVFEMPSKELENELQQKGVSIEIIDHHQYEWDDRSKEESSLEQFLQKLKLGDEQLQKMGFDPRFVRGVAICDKAYIYGLREAGYSEDEIRKIREFGNRAQLKEKFEDTLKRNEEIYASRVLKGDVVILETFEGDSSTIAGDRIVFDYPDKIPKILDFRKNKEGAVVYIFFSGPTAVVKELKEKCNPTFGGSGNTEKVSDFVGWVEPTKEKIEKIKQTLGIE